LFTKKPYLVQVAAAVAIFALIFGIRQSVPMFFSSINNHTGLGIVAVSLAFACGQLAWGAFQPFAGAISDKYGTEKALLIGIAMCVTGTLLIPYSTTQFELIVTIGILSAGGAGFAGNSVLMSAVNRFVPPGKGGLYAGFVNAGGSIGQFIMAPIAGWLIVHTGWENGLTYLALFCLVTVPLSLVLRGKKSASIVAPNSPPPLNLQQSLALAFKTPSYLMLNAGFSKARALIYNLICGLLSVIGGVIGYFFLEQTMTIIPYLLVFASSSFIYIAVSDLMPQMHRRFQLRESIRQISTILLGVLVVIGLSLLEH
jgi:MFS family permease